MSVTIIFNHVTSEQQAWREQAACKGKDTNKFFPDANDKKIQHDVKIMCAQCPVKIQCLEYAIINKEMHGIWGGMGHRSRRKYARNNNIR